jgi:hypothetical protein
MEEAQLTFFEALKLVADGKKITRLEWDDKHDYGFLRDGLLQLHKNGESDEVFHPWLINDGDLYGEDWIIV